MKHLLAKRSAILAGVMGLAVSVVMVTTAPPSQPKTR